MKTNMVRIIIAVALALSVAPASSSAQSGGAIFAAGPTMDRTRIFPFIATLSDNRVVAFGGREVGFISSSYSDIYTPSTNTFTEVPMNFPHDNTYVVKLSDGRYYIIGGSMSSGVAPGYSSCEIFRPSDNSYTTAGSMDYARMWMAAAQLNNGHVLIAGAWYDNTAAATGEYYDTAGHTYTLTGTLNTPRADALLLPTTDGGAMLFGGMGPFGSPSITATEYYSPTDNAFHAINSQLIPADPGWLISEDYHRRPYSDYQMSDGKYLMLASRPGEYGLISFDPATKNFARVTTTAAIMDTYTNGGFYDWVLDQAHNTAYLLGVDSGYDPIRVSLIAVDIASGNVYHPGSTFTLPSSEYPMPTLAFIPSNGKILLEGISSTSGDYFHATDKTYLITPQSGLGFTEVNTTGAGIVCYPNPANSVINFRLQGSTGDVAVNIYDPTGRLVSSRVSGTSSSVISVSIGQLPAGMYFYEIMCSGQVTRDKFIKQ